MASGSATPSGLSPQAEVAARAFVQLLARELSSTQTESQVNRAESRAESVPVRTGDSSTMPDDHARVRQAMRRQFPSMFNTDQPRGKKRFSVPAPSIVKRTDFHIFVLSKPSQFTPKGSEELELAYAGLGKRMLTIPDHMKHCEIVALLEEEFPKLKNLKGGWMFYKSTGGSGRRKLTIIPTDSEGYSTRLLKSSSNNGKNLVYVVPLQEQLSTEPLPYDSEEFAKMPQSNCITCGSQMPLQMLPLHVEGCKSSLADSDSGMCTVLEQPVPPNTEKEESSEVCPICLASFPTDVLPSHASSCGDEMDIAVQSEAGSTTRVEELPGPSVPRMSTPLSPAWTNEVDPHKACQLFREELLDRNLESRRLFLALDIFGEVDSSLICFYKMSNVNWAAPFYCRLEVKALKMAVPCMSFCTSVITLLLTLIICGHLYYQGDAAVGQGVNRHVLSMAMQKLKTGFSINLGSAGSTALFEGETEHWCPSAAAVLRESNLFEMAGRMMGHAFLHQGFGFAGMSLPVVTLLTGGSPAIAESSLTLEDCADLDHRETIGFLRNAELTAAETTRVTDLCLAWDLPIPTSTNRDWLFQELLSHAVLRRIKQPIKQIRKGLKDTGIWPLLSARPDVHPIVFPREADEELDSETVIRNICWPHPKTASEDEDSDEESPVPLEKISLVTGFLRKFIQEASQEELRDLMRFWVGWELPTTNLIVEVVTATYPVALTCFLKLKLPSHYQTYDVFHQDMMMALNSVSSGFGRV